MLAGRYLHERYLASSYGVAQNLRLTLREDVKRSVRQIRSVDGPIVGVILNQFDIDDRNYYYYRYYGYGENVKDGREAAKPA